MTDVTPLAQLADLGGRVAVVTGAGSGIGRAVCIRLAEAGARVLVVDLDEEAAQATVELLGSDTDGMGRARAHVADVRLPGDAVGVAQAAIDHWDQLDVLVNGAGIFPSSPVMHTSLELWERVMGINTTGTFLMSQACARVMGRNGTIVNMASKAAYQPSSGMAHYSASKGAVVQLTKALALELGPAGIRVNAVAPGSVDTEGARRLAASLPGSQADRLTEIRSAHNARSPMGRSAEPDEVARVVLFLSTDWSSYITGSTILVDGGWLLT
jgi:NAD(P)-dependent dehydrogenase (short-subunit alcohol dehydrogenase family)